MSILENIDPVMFHYDTEGTWAHDIKRPSPHNSHQLWAGHHKMSYFALREESFTDQLRRDLLRAKDKQQNRKSRMRYTPQTDTHYTHPNQIDRHLNDFVT